jgi:protein-tyrosine phosphatase
MAEIIAQQLTSESDLSFQSAGTASWHIGEPMDPRAAQALSNRGFDPTDHWAQQATAALLSESDLVIALDRKHHQILQGQVKKSSATLALLRPFDPSSGGITDVEDPYYGDDQGFIDCCTIIERSVLGLLAELSSGAV